MGRQREAAEAAFLVKPDLEQRRYERHLLARFTGRAAGALAMPRMAREQSG